MVILSQYHIFESYKINIYSAELIVLEGARHTWVMNAESCSKIRQTIINL